MTLLDRLDQPPEQYEASEVGEDSQKAADLLTEIQTSLELVHLPPLHTVLTMTDENRWTLRALKQEQDQSC